MHACHLFFCWLFTLQNREEEEEVANANDVRDATMAYVFRLPAMHIFEGSLSALFNTSFLYTMYHTLFARADFL